MFGKNISLQKWCLTERDITENDYLKRIFPKPPPRHGPHPMDINRLPKTTNFNQRVLASLAFLAFLARTNTRYSRV